MVTGCKRKAEGETDANRDCKVNGKPEQKEKQTCTGIPAGLSSNNKKNQSMEQKKKKQEDVLVVRDEKTGEISVVAGLDARGYPKRAQAKAEHSQEFLRFDRHGDAIDNFMRNFYRQCKEPTRFGFYRVAADTVEALLPVIKDLLKDPVANADLLAPHKVDTSAYQQAEEQQTTEEAKKENAETETEEQQVAEEVKRENAGTEAEEQQVAEEAKRENTEENRCKSICSIGAEVRALLMQLLEYGSLFYW